MFSLFDEKGSTLIEFAFAVVVFFAFLFGLFGITLWGTATFFIQDAAYEAAREYAVTLDANAARQAAMIPLGRWAYLFIDPGSASVEVSREGESAVAVVRAKPRVQRLYLYQMPELTRKASCTLEYRFRNPGEFSG